LDQVIDVLAVEYRLLLRDHDALTKEVVDFLRRQIGVLLVERILLIIGLDRKH
jgi:hypothetical protein